MTYDTTLTGMRISGVSVGRVESLTPALYRLAKKPDGTLVLQGAYTWHQGGCKGGHEWRDIPTVEVP